MREKENCKKTAYVFKIFAHPKFHLSVYVNDLSFTFALCRFITAYIHKWIKLQMIVSCV